MDLAAIAAFTAAALSFTNVLVTGRQSRQGNLHQWRRDTERPIIARILAISEGSSKALEDVAMQMTQSRGSTIEMDVRTAAGNEARKTWVDNTNEFEELRYQVAQLDLVADEPLRRAAHRLFAKHEDLRHYLRPASGAENLFDLFIEHNNEIIDLRQKLITEGRADLGITPRKRVRVITV